jgi:hypothetical protein
LGETEHRQQETKDDDRSYDVSQAARSVGEDQGSDKEDGQSDHLYHEETRRIRIERQCPYRRQGQTDVVRSPQRQELNQAQTD